MKSERSSDTEGHAPPGGGRHVIRSIFIGLTLAAFAVNVSCVPHDDQQVARVPLAPSNVIVAPETEALGTSSVPKEEVRHQSRAEILDGFERWARASMRFAFSSRSSRSDTCFDQRDAEVACSNPNAHRQETLLQQDVFSTVANRSDAAIVCQALDAPPSTSNPQAGMIVPPKATHSFATSATHGATTDARPWVVIRCEVALKDAVKLAAALPADVAEMNSVIDPLAGVEVSYAGSAETLAYVIFIGDKRFVHEGDDFREVP